MEMSQQNHFYKYYILIKIFKKLKMLVGLKKKETQQPA
jgi:hypothetical protein